MKTKTTLKLVTPLAAALLLAGCFGGEAEPAATPSLPTQQVPSDGPNLENAKALEAENEALKAENTRLNSSISYSLTHLNGSQEEWTLPWYEPTLDRPLPFPEKGTVYRIVSDVPVLACFQNLRGDRWCQVGMPDGKFPFSNEWGWNDQDPENSQWFKEVILRGLMPGPGDISLRHIHRG